MRLAGPNFLNLNWYKLHHMVQLCNNWLGANSPESDFTTQPGEVTVSYFNSMDIKSINSGPVNVWNSNQTSLIN